MRMTFTRDFYLPNANLNATKIESATGAAVVYVWTEERNGKVIPLAKGFSGKSNKPAFYHNFRTVEQRDKHVAEFLADAESLAKSRADRKAATKAAKAAIDSSKHTDGTIFVHSWGWEQTNVDFYKVVGRKSRTKLLVKPIAYKITRGNSGMSAYVVADLDSEGGEVMEVTLVEQNRITVGRSASYTYGKTAGVWDGKEMYCSWYA